MMKTIVVCALALAVLRCDLASAEQSSEAAKGAPPAASTLISATLFDKVSHRWAIRGFSTRMIDVNGVRLHVAEAGQGQLVIFLHGYPQSGEVWRLVAPAFVKTHHVVIPDLRGTGLSSVAMDGFDLSNLAEDIHQLVSALGYRKAIVVGHDWGGSVASVYAMRYRDEVTKLAFLESALPGEGFEDLWTFSKPNDPFTFIPFLLMAGPDPAHDTTVELIAGRESVLLRHLWGGFTADKQAAPFENWSSYIASMARPGVAKAWASYYRSVYRSAEEVRSLAIQPLAVPVLSIAGAKGIGARQEAFVKAFASNAKFALIAGSGHFVAEERPAELTALLQSFIDN